MSDVTNQLIRMLQQRMTEGDVGKPVQAMPGPGEIQIGPVTEIPNWHQAIKGDVAMQPRLPVESMGPPASLANDSYTSSLLKMLARVSRSGAAKTFPFGMVGTDHSGPLTEQEALQYVDFMSDDGRNDPQYNVEVGQPRMPPRYNVQVGNPIIGPPRYGQR